MFLVVLFGAVVSNWPRVVAYRAREKCDEARTSLEQVVELEKAFQQKTGHYGTAAQIGYFRTRKQLRAARYRVTISDLQTATFHATAIQREQGSLDTCDDGKDTWETSETGELQHTADGFASCTLTQTTERMLRKF